MFAICKKSASNILTVCLAVFSSFTLADIKQTPPKLHPTMNKAVCNTTGECSIDVSDTAKNILLACETPKVSIAWNRARKNSFLIACDCECTSHDNTGWLIDTNIATGKQNIKELHLGKRYTVEALKHTTSNIPDIFNSHPLCEKIDNNTLNNSIFVTLIKQPTNNDAAPYCFSPAYIIEDKKNLTIQTNNNKLETSLLIKREESLTDAEIINFLDEFQK
jgi:hypothetical protein